MNIFEFLKQIENSLDDNDTDEIIKLLNSVLGREVESEKETEIAEVKTKVRVKKTPKRGKKQNKGGRPKELQIISSDFNEKEFKKNAKVARKRIPVEYRNTHIEDTSQTDKDVRFYDKPPL